jgi:hypothetical protein
METIQYSLKNNTDYSIDIRLALKYSHDRERLKDKKNFVIEEPKTNDNNKNDNNKNDNNKNDNNKNDNDNENFNKSLLDIYGNHTCILFEISKDIFQLRFLDKTSNKIVKRSEFYIQIPTLAEKLYTVIVVEKMEDSNMEIVAIHSPPNNTSTVNNIITPSLK